MVNIRLIHQAIAAQDIPIVSVRIPSPGEIELDFAEAATVEQRAAAQAILDDWTDPPEPDWGKLEDSFRGTPLMGRCFVAAGKDLACNAAFTLLYGSITQTRKMPDFIWSLAQLRAAMIANPEIGDFTPAEKSEINTVLEAANFDPID